MSGTKKTIKSYQNIVAQSMGASITSSVTNVEWLDDIGLFVKWVSSDAVGVITVECSINYDPHLNTGDWTSLTFDPVLTQPASNNGSYLINIRQLPFPWLRVVYTRTSGTGTMDVYLSAKEI